LGFRSKSVYLAPSAKADHRVNNGTPLAPLAKAEGQHKNIAGGQVKDATPLALPVKAEAQFKHAASLTPPSKTMILVRYIAPLGPSAKAEGQVNDAASLAPPAKVGSWV
jgi:hypothetical protein